MPFLERVGVCFKHVLSGVAEGTAKQIYLAFRDALAWMAQSENKHCRAVILGVFNFGKPDKAHWEEALYAYRDHLSASVSQQRRNSLIKALRSALQALESGNVVPPLSVPLQGFKKARRQNGHLKSLAEVAPFSGTRELSKNIGDYVNFAQSQLVAAAKQFGIDLGKEEPAPFAAMLADELGCRDDLPSSHAEAISQILSDRLTMLHTAAAEIVDRWRSHHAEGQRFLASTSFNATEFYEQRGGPGFSTILPPR